MDDFTNLSNYQLRYSNQARYLQLRISHSGLEVIVPRKGKWTKAEIHSFIETKKKWIEKNWQKYSPLECEGDNNKTGLPNVIHLKACETVWEVKYIKTISKQLVLHSNASQQLSLTGKIEDHTKCLFKLRQWLLKTAYTFLYSELESLAAITGLEYVKFSIRNNSTRWGSCSPKKHISACCKLLFIEPHLMRHVLIHELCHTKVMNHSQRFWLLLTKHDPKAREHAKELIQAAREIPSWIR